MRGNDSESHIFTSLIYANDYISSTNELALTVDINIRDYIADEGPGGSIGKALSYGLDGPGSIPGVGGVEIFLHSFVSRLVLGFPGGKGGRA